MIEQAPSAPMMTGVPTSQQTGFIVWNPYAGESALLLAAVLLAIGLGAVLAGSRFKRDVKLPTPWRWLQAVIVVVWALQILVLLRIFKHISSVDPSASATGPVLPVTLASAAVAFGLVAYRLRRSGVRTSVGSGLAAALAGPMVFEFPFVLIVGPVGSTPTDPGAALVVPFFIAMITTLAFLTFTSRAAFTRYSTYAFGAMFLVFAAWALLGFAYPGDTVTLLLNAVSKVLGFATAALLFVRK